MEKDFLTFLFHLFRDEFYNFRGYDEENEKTIFGKYNRAKRNPKEPDLRLYYSDEEKEFLSLWCKISRSGIKYLIGNKDGICYIGLINQNRLSDDEPYLTIYDVTKFKRS